MKFRKSLRFCLYFMLNLRFDFNFFFFEVFNVQYVFQVFYHFGIFDFEANFDVIIIFKTVINDFTVWYDWHNSVILWLLRCEHVSHCIFRQTRYITYIVVINFDHYWRHAYVVVAFLQLSWWKMSEQTWAIWPLSDNDSSIFLHTMRWKTKYNCTSLPYFIIFRVNNDYIKIKQRTICQAAIDICCLAILW